MLTQSFCRIFYFIAVLISTIKAQYCTAQEDCTSPTASFCDLGNLQCVPCSVSSDCAHLTKEHICDNLRCYECLTTPDCQTIYNDVLISCDATNYCEGKSKYLHLIIKRTLRRWDKFWISRVR